MLLKKAPWITSKGTYVPIESRHVNIYFLVHILTFLYYFILTYLNTTPKVEIQPDGQSYSSKVNRKVLLPSVLIGLKQTN